MDLRSDKPYSLLKNGILHSFPSLHENIDTDVAIIGAGISGALIAWHLTRAGIPCVVADKRHAAMGSTAASTSILQYEIDTPLQQLIKLTGEKNAADAYLLCRKSIYDLQKICLLLNEDAGFEMKPSFQFASQKKDESSLKTEYQLRKNIGIDIEYLTSSDIKEKFGFKKSAGLLSQDGAIVDVYKLTLLLLKDAVNKGAQVFDNTLITKINYNKNGAELQTEWGKKIKAKKVIIACGYESQKYIQRKVETLYSTYAIVSEPLADKEYWYKNAIIWETARPYLYIRPTPDNRILVGGKDDEFYNPDKRDSRISKKSKQLKKDFDALFPHIPFRTDFAWAGTFGSTKDGLPFIGCLPAKPHTYFALGYGGNGITFSVIAAQLITELLRGSQNPNLKLFSFNR